MHNNANVICLGERVVGQGLAFELVDAFLTTAYEGGRHEIANVLKTIFDGKWDITDEELTPLLLENYTAVLLVCDPEGGEPETFCTVKGALGGSLTVNEAGLLTWDAESFVSSFFSPATSSFSIGADCRVLRCTFDGEGNLIGQEDTGETVPYRR